MPESEPTPNNNLESEMNPEQEEHFRSLAQRAKEAFERGDFTALDDEVISLGLELGIKGFDIERAKGILGEDCLGPEEVKQAFGIEIDPNEIPPIPFSKEELEKAKELNQMLILRLPITMARINEALKGKVKDGGKLLYSFDESTGELKADCWYKDEAFYREELTEVKWALVSKEIIPDSTSKNYLEQTDLIVDYLKNRVFGGGALPEEYQQAIDGYQRIRVEIEGMIDSDWRKAAEMLQGLEITQLTRQSPAEALYDLSLYFQTNGERLMPDQYIWTGRRSSVGVLVYLGYFGSDGVAVALSLAMTVLVLVSPAVCSPSLSEGCSFELCRFDNNESIVKNE